jgi:NAD(P)-dependent dehydrogenase (short-subunit alcohol dehydrogenase family)
MMTRKLAVVTGASRGLGRHIATALAARGCDLVLVGRDKPRLLAAGRDISDLDPKLRLSCLDCDLSRADAPALVAAHVEAAGGADILVNNAAIQGPIGKAWEAPGDEFDDVLRLNFLVPAALCRAVIPQMMAKKAGWIVNISGGGATSPRPMFSAYAAAKTALVRFSETLAAEGAPIGLRVNSVAPGAFNSGMTDAMLAAAEIPQKELETAQMLKRGDSDEVPARAAELIAYLVAGEGRDVTGKLISAVWDDWRNLHRRSDLSTDIFTLRRIADG